MRIHHLSLAAAALASTALPQDKAIVFTLEESAIGLDAVNERAGGTINAIEELALTTFVPGRWVTALTALPTTAHAAFRGDPDNTGNYSIFDGLRAPNESFWFTGVFFKDADKASGDITRAFFTVQDQVGKNFTVWTGGGASSRVILPGDWFRWLPNGDVEVFITQRQIQDAAGNQPGPFAAGAIAICQAPNGDLFYTPTRTNGGGHWVSGNNFVTGPEFANDGSICWIPAADITYDARGDVQAVRFGSARLLWEEVQAGPGGLSVRGMVANAGHNDITGAAGGSVTFNMVGLDIDPNGGTVTASFDEIVNGQSQPIVVPNLVFTFDNPWVSTVFSTSDAGTGVPGSIAVINGVKMGEDITGVPATGVWVGTQSSVITPGQFGKVTPTLKGLAVIDAPPEPIVLDAPNAGAVTATNPDLVLDVRGLPGSPVFPLAAIGPFVPGSYSGATRIAGGPLGPLFDGSTFPYLFFPRPAIGFPTVIADPNGYGTLSLSAVFNPSLVGLTLEFHAIGVVPPSSLKASNPVQLHFK